MRCTKKDGGGFGCIKQAGHRARHTVRPDPDSPRRRVEGQKEFVKAMGTAFAEAALPRPAAPNCSTVDAVLNAMHPPAPARPGIEPLAVQDIVASKAARKTLCGMAKAILYLFEPKPTAKKG